jgi:hypothetical protein
MSAGDGGTSGDLAANLAFAAAFAVIAFLRVPKFEQRASIQRALGFVLALSAAVVTYEDPPHIRPIFIALSLSIAFADFIANKESKYRRGIDATIAYGLSLWLIAALMMWIGFTAYGGDYDLHKTWPPSLWLDLIPTVLYAVTTAVLAIESLLYNERGTWKRATFCVAALANTIFAAVQISKLLDFWPDRQSVIHSAAALIVLGAIGSFVIYRRERAHADVGPAIGLLLGAIFLVEITAKSQSAEYLAAHLTAAALIAVIAAAFGNKRPGYSNLRVVWIIPALIPVLFESYGFDPHDLTKLFGALLIGVNLLQYLRTRGKDAVDRALITSAVSVACVSLAVWIHAQFSWSAWGGLTCDGLPWIVIVEPELTALVLAVGAFVVARRIWKRNVASLWAVFAVSVFCAATVYFPPPNSRILHIWVVTAAALAALIFSLFKKRGRWFVYGFGWIALIFFRETSAFWLSLKWWIYLLAVGLMLVAIAAVNEAGRRKGAGLIDKLKQSRIRAWRW